MTPSVRDVVTGLAFPEGPIVDFDGSVVLSEMAAGRVVRVDSSGRVEQVAALGGGPNGLARLPDGSLLVCQNGGSRWGKGPWPRPGSGSVEIFRPTGPPDEPVTPQVQLIGPGGRVRTLATRFSDSGGDTFPLSRPSDLCVDAHGGFYMTDGGATRGRSRDVTGVLYGTPDGILTEVIFPLEMPNGIALSPDSCCLYVAETRTRRIWECELVGVGEVGAMRSLATVPSGGPMSYGGVDGLAVASDGVIIAATLGTGGVTVLSPDGEHLGALALDDPMTTNVAVSRDGSSLFVTLASSGRLVEVSAWRDLIA